jgi:hypothetical protein
MADDLLTTIRAEIDSRLGELQPMLEEYEELSALSDALVADGLSASQGIAAFALAPSASETAADGSPAKKLGRRRSTATRRRATAAPRAAAAEPRMGAPVRPPVRPRARARGRSATIDATGQAILAALEHGSHTVAELVTVTALPASQIRESLRELRTREAIVKTERESRTAYALPASIA